MRNKALGWVVLSLALLLPAVGSAQISCVRGGLQRAVDLYIAAQTKGDTSELPLAPGLGGFAQRLEEHTGAMAAHTDLLAGESKLLWQAHRLAATMHENLRAALIHKGSSMISIMIDIICRA